MLAAPTSAMAAQDSYSSGIPSSQNPQMTARPGQNHQPVATIEQDLIDIFDSIPSSYTNETGQRVIPAHAIPDVFHALPDSDPGVELTTSDELAQLQQVLTSNPGIEVTPQMFIGFMAMRATNTLLGRRDFEDSPGQGRAISQPDRGREPERSGLNPRSSSKDSIGAAYMSSSRQSLREPLTWSKRPATASRRNRSAGSRSRTLSDSEQTPEYVDIRPTIARTIHTDETLRAEPVTDVLTIDHSQLSSPDGNFSFGASAPPHARPVPLDDDSISPISSLPMPRHGSDSQFDGSDTSHGLVIGPSMVSSTAQLEALQRANADLGRKLIDAERTLQDKLSDHETELEEMQSRVDELRSELSASKREERELQSKEHTNVTQIAALESEIAKQQRSIESARSAYASLQKQYVEQCSESERYRNQLRQRDPNVKDYHDQSLLQASGDSKRIADLEGRIAELEREGSKEDVILPPQGNLRRRRVRGFDTGQSDGSSSADEAEYSRRDQALREFKSTLGDSSSDWQTWLNGPMWIAPSFLPQYISTRLSSAISADMVEPLHHAISPYQLMQDATVDSDWEAILSKLLTEWYYVGASLIGIAALYAAVFGFASSTIFPVDGSAQRTVALGATAAGMGIVSNLWLIFLYGRLDPACFKRKAMDIFGSYYFFCLTARLPAFFLALASFALMVFLVIVAWLTWRAPVIGLGIFTTMVLVLQYVAFIARSTFVLLGKALASAYEAVRWAYAKAVDFLSFGSNPKNTIPQAHHPHGRHATANAASATMPPASPSSARAP